MSAEGTGVAPLLGLTGGIASGKSTVARMLRELGVPLLDADEVAREVVAPGSEGFARVVARFGQDVSRNGALDRARLAAIVFADPAARSDLEAIVHPLVAARSAERLRSLRADPSAPYVVYEVPLLIEKGLHTTMGMEAVLVVDLPEEEQITRLKRRDRLSEAAARARLAAQVPRLERLAVADFVLDNSGTPQRTREQVLRVHRELLHRFATRKR